MKLFSRMIFVIGLLLLLGLATSPVIAQDDVSVRIAYAAFDPAQFDTYIDGEIASFSPGWEKVGWKTPLAFWPIFHPDVATPYLTFDSGDHSFAFVPLGENMDAAILGPENFTFEAGHRYSLALIGDLEAGNLQLLAIDETEACGDIDLENNFVAFATTMCLTDHP